MRTILWPKNLTFQNSAGPKARPWPCGWTVTGLFSATAGFSDGRTPFYVTGDGIITRIVTLPERWILFLAARTEFYEHCHIHCLGNGYITAASTPADHPFGYVFSHCQITGENPDVKTYLGRPWRAYASVTFLNTEMSALFVPSAGTIGGTGTRNDGALRRIRQHRPRRKSAGACKMGASTTERQAAAITVEKVLGGSDALEPPIRSGTTPRR